MLTKPRNLRTGHTLWESMPAPHIPYAPLQGDTKTEIAIVGAGISGAMLAEELTEAGFAVLLLDRRGPLLGSTTATTALLQYEIDTPLSNLSRSIGEEKAVRTWRRSKLGLDSLASKIQSLGISCDYKQVPSLYLSGNLLDAQGLEKEREVRAAAGLPVQYLTKAELKVNFGITRSAALKTYGSLSVNPRRLAAGFLLKAISRGARVAAPVTVDEVLPSARQVRLTTLEGPIITAKQVIFATGYELPKYIPAKHHAIHSTWAIATAPQVSMPWPEECFIWEAAEPYLYMRLTKDRRIICGGEDEPFADAETRDALIAKKTSLISRKLKKLFPAVDSQAEFAWAGAFGASDTGLPSIGVVPGLPHCHAVLGYGGNGITFSRIAAEIIRASLTGKQDPDAELFAFS